MPWATTRAAGTNPKYRSKEHRDTRARLERLMQAQGYLVCQQPVCVMESRIIRRGMPWHLGHDDSGTQFIGPVCARCNRVDGAKRGNRRSRGQASATRWDI